MSTRAHQDRIAQLSPAKLALLERWRQFDQRNLGASSIPRRASEATAPLSFAQQRLWFLDQLEPQNPFYNVAAAVRLSGSLHADTLERALQLVISRHEALRTTFSVVDGQARQVIAACMNWSMARFELSDAKVEHREAAWQHLAVEESLRPFNLEVGPLMRGTLIRLGHDDHVLLLTLHHIICDGWSMGVLRQEVAENYAALIAGRSPALQPLAISYADFATWQRQQVSGDALEELLAYWSKQLAELPPPLEMPLDFPRPAEQTFRGAVRRRLIDRELTSQLRQTARSEDATLFMLLVAAFQVMLSRTCSQRDFCIGTPIANRNRVELEHLIGFFANTLALRADLSANPSLRNFLGQVRQSTLAAYAHQDLPFERLIEHIQPERDLSRTPLFQVMFVLQNIPFREQRIAGITARDVSFDHAPVSHFDLTLNVNEHSDRLELSLIYNPDLFLRETVDELLDSYETLLTEFCGELDRRVLEVPAVQRTRIAEWNNNERNFPDERTIHDLISEQAQRTPGALAVVADDDSLTYCQLDRRANQLARFLTLRGVGPDTVVGLCVERSTDLIVGLLGILKAGGAYLPLDPAYPQSRLDFMLRDAALEVVITTSTLVDRLPEAAKVRVLLDTDCELFNRQNDDRVVTAVAANNLVYVLYTSGSTGDPKAVEVEHRGVVNHAIEFARRIELAPGDRILQFLSMSFDAAAEEIFPTLISGATLRIHPAPVELSGRTLLEWSRDQAVNVLHLTPPVWLSLADEISLSGSQVAEHLKCVVVGGDSVLRTDADQWHAQTGGRIPLFMAYGVTEATITTTLFKTSDGAPPSPTGRVPIGRPICNTRVHILDENSQPVAIGVTGELYLGGIGVARGYRNRPQLTASRFLPDPFSGQPGSRMYRTGDRGRYLHDGSIEFLGRLDQQLKIRGFRIEPGEIETALAQHTDVREAVVAADDDGHGAKRLVAYVSTHRNSVDEHGLAVFLAERLPRHMQPAVIVVLDDLPRLPNGKIDRKSLPRFERASGPYEARLAPPRNDVERHLAEIWADVLGLPKVGIHDNFFEVGGDSIRSIQVIARAGAMGIRFTPKQLFQNQTIAELAPLVVHRNGALADQQPVTGLARLTPIQRYFFELEITEPHHFNQSVLLKVRADLLPTTIEAALQQLFVHHDALRMSFIPTPNRGWQQVGLPPIARPVVQIVDFSAIGNAELPAMIGKVATTAQASLALATGDLVRCVYFDLGSLRPARLLIAIHHLAVDAVSWRIFLEDFSFCCVQLSHGATAPQLPLKTTSFAEWARQLEALADSQEIRRQLPFWTSLPKAPRIPRDTSVASNCVADEATVEIGLSVTETSCWIYESGNAYRTRPHELLIAAVAETIAQYTGQQNVRVDIEGHGREDFGDRFDLSRTIGWFTSLYPVSLTCPSKPDPSGLIKSVKEQLRAIPTGGIGYGLLRWSSNDKEVCRQMTSMDESEVSFNYLGQFDGTLPADAPFALAAESAGANRSQYGKRPHLWEIIAYVRDGRLRVEWRFASTIHRRDTIARLAEALLVNLRHLIEHCLDPLSGGVTPTDFPLAEIDQSDLDHLSALLDTLDSDS